MIKNFFKSLLGQKAQTMVLYALLVPVLMTVGGVAVDLGWYYMNASRLQNMADSAVIAGSEVLLNPLKEGELTDYTYSYLLPSLPNSTNLSKSDRKTDKSDAEAKNYIGKNLSNNNWNGDKVQDNFSNSELTFAKNVYKEEDDSGFPVLYYEIELTEKHNHIFEFLNSLDTVIKKKAVAKITHVDDKDDDEPGLTLVEQMEALKEAKVYHHFDEIWEKYAKIYDKNKSELIDELIQQGKSQSEAEVLATSQMGDRKNITFKQAQDRTIQSTGNWWLKNLTTYRTENSTLRGTGGTTWNVDHSKIDDLFINFKEDVSCKFTSDWDLEESPPKSLSYTSYNHIFDSADDPKKVRYNFRIHSLIGLESERSGTNVLNKFPYKVRADKDAPDPLYALIEREQIIATAFNPKNTAFNSVHQIIININFPNTLENDRPLVFFYDGPEKFDENSSVRDSEPVILNLNADFRGILYMPNSPVVVVGNGHNFEGFIVAKEFVKLKTAADFEAEGYKKIVRKDNNNEIFVKESDITSSEIALSADDYIELKNYKSDGKNYYIERTCDYYEKITIERVNANAKFEKIPVPSIIVDNKGNVKLKGELTATVDGTEKAKNAEEPDKIFTKENFNLASSKYNSFLLVKFANYNYLNKVGGVDNMFIYNRALTID